MERDQCKSHRNEIREKPRNHINKKSITVVLRDDNAMYWDSPIVKGFLLFERKGKIALSSCKNTPTLEDFILTTLINSNRDITRQSNALTEIHRPFRWRCYTKRKIMENASNEKSAQSSGASEGRKSTPYQRIVIACPENHIIVVKRFPNGGKEILTLSVKDTMTLHSMVCLFLLQKLESKEDDWSLLKTRKAAR